jgi:hypothetical protein
VDREDERFLPPEPPGPEPELGNEGQQPQQPQQPQPTPPPQQQPPQQPPPPGYGQPPPGYQQPPPAYQQPPPAYQQPPPGYQQPPPGYQQPGYYQPAPWQQPGYLPPAPPPPPQPPNSEASTGFVLSMVSAGLWLFSAGLSSIISIGLAAFGIVWSRKGKKRVQSGETLKNKDLAQAGYITGIVMVVLATLSTLAWVLVIVLAATDDEFQNDLENEFDESNSFAVRLVAAVARPVLQLAC